MIWVPGTVHLRLRNPDHEKSAPGPRSRGWLAPFGVRRPRGYPHRARQHPYGSWAVQTITVAAGWVHSQNPNLDFAFLTVTPPPGTKRPIQFVTGGLRLGINVGYAHPIYVIGYNDTDDQPIGCATTSFKFETDQMKFYCNAFWDGTSGGPWIVHYNRVTGSGIVIGDIGGYEQGGDYPWASYSAYYSWPILRLFLQAQHQQT